MTKKWIAITLLLLVFAVLLGRQLHTSVLRFYAENDLSKLQPAPDLKQKVVPETPPQPPEPSKKLNPSEFAVIPDNNVFSESRAREEKVEIAAPPETPPLAQKPILVGVTIVDNAKRASIIDPTGSPQERNRRAQIKRIGDSYHGYILTDITMNSIVLESGTRREVIPLHEGAKRPQSGKTAILSTRVVAIGGASSGGTPVSVAAGSAVRTTTTPIGSAKTATPPAGSATISAQPQPAAVEAPAAAARPTQPRTGTVETDSQGRRVIQTPFGPIARPIRE